MSTYYGVNKTKFNTPIGSNIVDSGSNKGQVCSMYDSYEADGVTAASVIQMCDKLPKGSRVVRIEVIADDLGTGNTIDVGDATTVDRYADGVNIASAATATVFPSAAEIAGVGYVITGSSDDQLQIVVNTAAASGTIKMQVMYVI